MPLQIRRGTDAERDLLATVPQEGELIYITDTQQLFVGDGTNLLKDISPITGYTDENAVDAVGSALSGGTHSGITFVYGETQDGADRIDANINPTQSLTNLTVIGNTTLGNTTLGATTVAGTLSVTGKLIADFNGSIYADDSTLLVDGVDSRINLDGTVKGNIIPDVTEAYDIGSSSLKFKDLYLSGSSLWLGAAQITSTSTVINLPAGSTIDGEVIQAEVSEEDAFVRDLQGSVFGDDSTLLVDAIGSKIVGPVENTTVTTETVTTGLININQDLAEGGLIISTEMSLDDNFDLFTINSYHSDSISSGVSFTRARGSFAVPEVLQTDDEVFSITVGGYGSDSQRHLVSRITASVDGALQSGGTIIPGKLVFYTVDNTETEQLGLSIDSNQLIGVSNNNVTTANSGVGTADVTGGVATYLKVKIGSTTYAIPAYGLVT